MEDVLEDLSHDKLLALVRMYAKNAIALDGVWFQAVEHAEGMVAAMRFDIEAWDRFGRTEGRRIKKLLALGEHPGLEGLAAALPFRFQSTANEYSVTREADAVIYRIEACRVQKARERKGLGFHPCKEVGVVEHPSFARAIDDRVVCTCESCYPDVADETCSCAWRFTLDAS